MRWRDVLGPSQSRLLLPWGFVPGQDVLNKVAPRVQRLVEESKLYPAASTSSSSSSSSHHHHHPHYYGNEMIKELFHSLSNDFAKGSEQAYLAVVQSFLAPPSSNSNSSSSSSTYVVVNAVTRSDLECAVLGSLMAEDAKEGGARIVYVLRGREGRRDGRLYYSAAIMS